MELPSSGIVTTSWIMAPDGKRYMVFFCRHWDIVTDEQVPVKNFRSHEKWTLAGYVGDTIKILIPGCHVTGFVACETPPQQTEKMIEAGKYTDIPVGVYNIS